MKEHRVDDGTAMKGRGKAASTSDYQIRPATELDVPQMLECLREVFESSRLGSHAGK